MAERARILLADDHAMLRGSLKTQLERESGFEVVAAVSTADEAVAEAVRTHPHVILMDIDMPGRSSFDAARAIKAQIPDARIVFLSAFFHDRYIEQAIAVEASGYLTKAEPPEHLVQAIRAVMSGASCYSPEVQARIVIGQEGHHRLKGQARTRAAALTERELAVLRYVARGFSKKQIADLLDVTPSAIDRHCTRLMAKLDIHDRVELARYAIREGLAEP